MRMEGKIIKREAEERRAVVLMREHFDGLVVRTGVIEETLGCPPRPTQNAQTRELFPEPFGPMMKFICGLHHTYRRDQSDIRFSGGGGSGEKRSLSGDIILMGTHPGNSSTSLYVMKFCSFIR